MEVDITMPNKMPVSTPAGKPKISAEIPIRKPLKNPGVMATNNHLFDRQTPRKLARNIVKNKKNKPTYTLQSKLAIVCTPQFAINNHSL